MDDRNSHEEFFVNRDYSRVVRFWSDMLSIDQQPVFVAGDDLYGPTDLVKISRVGELEYSSDDPRYKKKTFALRIGYAGDKYHGFQMQKGTSTRTVEEVSIYPNPNPTYNQLYTRHITSYRSILHRITSYCKYTYRRIGHSKYFETNNCRRRSNR